MQTNPSHIQTERTALLVMDFQPGILHRLEVSEDMVARVGRLIEAARKAKVAVGFVHVALTEEERVLIPATNKSFSQIPAGMMLAGSADTDVDPRLQPQAEDIIVRKRRVGAMSTTDLHEQLKERRIDRIVLAGISTSGVVLSTVRDAADRDYRIYVLKDACADPDPEVHALLMDRVFPRQADVLTAAEFESMLPPSE